MIINKEYILNTNNTGNTENRHSPVLILLKYMDNIAMNTNSVPH